jgi:integrase/recombinase XerD
MPSSSAQVHVTFAAGNYSGAAEPIPSGLPIFLTAEWRIFEPPTFFVRERLLENSGSRNTAASYASILKLFFNALVPHGLDWDDLSYEHILGFRQFLIAHKYAASTINQRIGVVRGFYRWCIETGNLEHSPFPSNRKSRLKIANSPPLPRAIPRSDLVAIMANMPSTYSLCSRLAVMTGLRAFEVASLKVSQLPDPTTYESGFVKFSVRRKGGKNTEVSAPAKLIDEIHHYVDFGARAQRVRVGRRLSSKYVEPEEIFLSNRGQVMRASRLSKMFTAARIEAGIAHSEWTFHSLRHTFAITLLKYLQLASNRREQAGELGINALLTLRNLLGHRHISSTEIYLSSLAQDEAAISDSLSALYDALGDNDGTSTDLSNPRAIADYSLN